MTINLSLIADQRYYGETPAGLPRYPHAAGSDGRGQPRRLDSRHLMCDRRVIGSWFKLVNARRYR